MSILYVDTESDEVTKLPISVQCRYSGINYVFTDFTYEAYHTIHELWNAAEAVIMFNAPYDLGVLSAMFTDYNGFEWISGTESGHWDMYLFGNRYNVRRINGFRNIIRCLNKRAKGEHDTGKRKAKRPASTPVIDLLKLWSILVDDGSYHSISLKALIQRELHEDIIPYSAESAKSYDYQIQDVVCLEKLWELFLTHVSTIDDVRGYTYRQWGKVCTPATLCKAAYAAAYPELGEWQKANDAEDKTHGLASACESAYHGGITIALHRGRVSNTAWYDIHGAYAHVIEYLNTDRYMKYSWCKRDTTGITLERDATPLLCRVIGDVRLTDHNKSLKLYKLRTPCEYWAWSYDILALKALFPTACITINEAYEAVPLLDIHESLATTWSRLKELEQKLHGKTTLREYYKFMSNTSYGVKAQREPWRTKHTNMVIAGIITSRAHLILAEMIRVAEDLGCIWVYSDTDSICVALNGVDAAELEMLINKRVAPYSVECEHAYGTTRVLSLKRYTAVEGVMPDGRSAADKVRLHGKSVYKVDTKMLAGLLAGEPAQHKPMIIAGVTANTGRTYNRVLKLNPCAAEHPHPFMFETSCRADISVAEWFDSWYAHIDTKTTYPDNAHVDDEFERKIRIFDSEYHARTFYTGKLVDPDEAGVPVNDQYHNWDAEDEYNYSSDCSSEAKSE